MERLKKALGEKDAKKESLTPSEEDVDDEAAGPSTRSVKCFRKIKTELMMQSVQPSYQGQTAKKTAF